MKVVKVCTRTAAIRMATLLVAVAALDATVVFFVDKPRFWASTIPGLIPLLTPFVLFSFQFPGKREV